MLYVVTRGMTQGRHAGILSALGVICGILVHTIAAAFGLTLVLQTSAFAFLLVKYVGAAYLIYLGFKAWRNKSTFSLQAATSAVSSRLLFWQGVLSNVFNPKIAIFFWSRSIALNPARQMRQMSNRSLRQAQQSNL